MKSIGRFGYFPEPLVSIEVKGGNRTGDGLPQYNASRKMELTGCICFTQ